MQKIGNLYILASTIAFIISFVNKSNDYDNYFAYFMSYYTIRYTNLILHNFWMAMVFGVQKLIVHVVFGQMKENQRIKIFQKLKYRIIDLLFFIMLSPKNLDFGVFFTALFLVLSFIMHNLAVLRSQYLSNTHSLDLKEHYKLLGFFVSLMFLDYALIRNMTMWLFSENGLPLAFLYYNLTMFLFAIEPFLKFCIIVYQRFTFYQFKNLDYKLNILNLSINLPRLIILIIIGLWIAVKFKHSFFFIIALLENVMDLIQLVRGFQSMIKLTKTMDHLPYVSKEQIVSKYDDICMVCFRQMDEGRKLPCSHVFHSQCLKQWIQKNSNHFCPKCRSPFDFEPKAEDIKQIPVRIQEMNDREPNQILRINNVTVDEILSRQRIPIQIQRKSDIDIDNILINQIVEQVNQSEEIETNEAGSLPFCLPMEAVYFRKKEDFLARQKIKSLNAQMLSLLQLPERTQMLLIDE